MSSINDRAELKDMQEQAAELAGSILADCYDL
jgi:hypothetical protein